MWLCARDLNIPLFLFLILFIFQSALASVVHLPDEEILVRKALGSMLEIFNQTLFVELTVKEVLWGYDNKLIGKAFTKPTGNHLFFN